MSIAKVIAMMGAGGFARYIGENHYATTGVSRDILYPAEALSGDLAIIFGGDNGGLSNLTSWTHLSPISSGTTNADVWWKRLTAADITAGKVTVGSTSNGGLVAVTVYRGLTSAAVASSATTSSSGAALDIPGYTKSATARGVLTFVVNGQASGGSIITPVGATTRIAAFGTTNVSVSTADFLPAAAYVDGATVTWPSAGSAFGAVGQLLELT